MNTPPLEGITIVDLSRVLSGPYCTMLAADMGARVIKVEHPVRGDDTRLWGPPFVGGESVYFLSVNRNKESIALDLRTDDGLELLESLVSRADVLVENFRPGTLASASFDYASVAARHPALVYVSISGFGQTGPRRAEPGYDVVAQAEGGLMSITGSAEGEAVRLGVAIGDITAGMYAFQGMLLGLLSRARTGRGQHVDVSLLDAITSVLTYQAARYLLAGSVPERTGNRHMTIAPYDAFHTADGVVVLAVGTDAQWQQLCAVLQADALGADPRFATNALRVGNYPALHAMLTDVLVRQPLRALLPALRDAGIPCGTVRSVPDALADPQVAARAMIETVEHPDLGAIRLLGLPVKMSETPGRVRTPPPRLGEHTRDVLTRDLGLDDARVDALARRGVLGSALQDQLRNRG